MAQQDGAHSNSENIEMYDYYKPSLFPGLYNIDVKQIVKDESRAQEIHIYNYDGTSGITPPWGSDHETIKQSVNIVAPQFELDPKLINSYYPPDGFVDEGRVLPHIVFDDPHVPWMRPPWPETALEETQQKPWPPWIALVVFDPKELSLSPLERTDLGLSRIATRANQSSGAYTMSVKDYLTGISSKPNYDVAYTTPGKKGKKLEGKLKELQEKTTPTDVIFPTRKVFEEIFGKPEEFRLFSHVRKVNTANHPDHEEHDKGLYAITVSRRSGPIMAPNRSNPPASRMQTVHLVSIECLVGENDEFVPPSGEGRVGLISLFSWNYLCTPPSPSNFITTMQELADNQQMLMPPLPILKTLATFPESVSSKKKAASEKLHMLLSSGYSITRWRTATGDETTAFFRGPLSPVSTPSIPSSSTDWPESSITGKEFQILDKSTGLMNLTYSSAWQLGKLLAISDSVFASALSRLRSTIHQRALSETRMKVDSVTPARMVINDSPMVIDAAGKFTDGRNVPTRILQPSNPSPRPPISDPNVARIFRSNVAKEVSYLLGVNNVDGVPNDTTIYTSPDAEIVKNWIANKFFLDGIPAHYLFSDPSHLASSSAPAPISGPIDLPPEALRFFYIDHAWLDCFLDGALSIANHLEPVNDIVRKAIKEFFNTALRPVPGTTPKWIVPRCGFVLRSILMRVIPDIKVTATGRKLNDPELVDPSVRPLVKLTRLDSNTLFALLDCPPENLHTITLAQPPHQMRLVAPVPPALGLPYLIKQLFTEGGPDGIEDDGVWPEIPSAATAIQTWYNRHNRCVEATLMAHDLERILTFNSSTARFDSTIGSAAFALQLNDKSYQFDIKPPHQSRPVEVIPRQIWMGRNTSSMSQSALPLHQEFIRPGASGIIKLSIRPRVPNAPSNTIQVAQSPSPNWTSPRIRSGPRISFTSPPTLASLRSTYTLSVRPSYRGPAPLPFTDGATPPWKVFSSQDYLPSASPYLVDLVFALQRTVPENRYPISSLTIVIPTTGGTQSSGEDAEEPLLVSTTGGHMVEMIHNKRFVPLLTSAPGQLQIKLVPRHAGPGQIKSVSGQSAVDASFVLKGVDIASIKTSKDVEIMGAGPPGTTTGKVGRGLVKVLVQETYRVVQLGTRTRHSIFDIVKHQVSK